MIKFFKLIYSQLKILSNEIAFVDEDIEYVKMCCKSVFSYYFFFNLNTVVTSTPIHVKCREQRLRV